MTLYQFNALDEMEQIETAREKAAKLAERKDDDHIFELYQLDGFYIELRGPLDSPGYNNIRTFSTTALLEPYLELMKMPPGF